MGGIAEQAPAIMSPPQHHLPPFSHHFTIKLQPDAVYQCARHCHTCQPVAGRRGLCYCLRVHALPAFAQILPVGLPFAWFSFGLTRALRHCNVRCAACVGTASCNDATAPATPAAARHLLRVSAVSRTNRAPAAYLPHATYRTRYYRRIWHLRRCSTRMT